MADREAEDAQAQDARRASGGDRTAKSASQVAEAKKSQTRRVIVFWQLFILLILIAGMKLLNTTSGNLVMPSPEAVFWQSVEMWSDGTIPRALGESFAVLGLGFVLAATSGILIGILLGGFPFIGRVLDPYVNAVNATPSAAFIPLIIVWFGLYTEAKVMLVWLAAVFPILINTTAGIANANRDLVEMAESFGAPRRRLFWQVMVPDALPSILSGLRIGAAICIVGTVIAELTMAQSGLGGLMIKAGNRFQMDRYFAVVIVMMALGSLITIALRLAERKFGRWRVEMRGGD
ncbi:ABC transporter permease [Flavimaricola marinus]|uniref:Putative aliphatic sulfonates transport permease protein SsuC n=1 Tax=Flavimaricola marinus TaxID=1819565 RepID=A0A238LC29_9RHOB|nr:ABC transporter permease [Flavimaricola marinus]SMY06965.1 Putative aliphatic sulfonates transport permease protein SsuC [Flavimaricola marinus]